MKNNNKVVPSIIISVMLHLLLLAALLWGADFSMSKPVPSGKMVQTVVIDSALVKKQANEIRRQRQSAAKAEQDRLDKLRRQTEQLEKNRLAEEERIRKAKEEKAKAEKAAREAERKAREAQKRREAEQEKARQEKAKAEAEHKKQQEAIKKAEQERLKKEAAVAKAEKERQEREAAVARAEKERQEKEAAAARAEKERQEKEAAAARAEKKRQEEESAAARAEKERLEKEQAAKEAREKARKEQQRLERLERERKEREAALGDIFAGLEAEANQNNSAKQQFVESELGKYSDIYSQRIQNNLRVEESFRNKFCRINLKLLPTGKDAMVSRVKILEGDSRLCAATQRAVMQVTSFPLPTDQDVVKELRNINLTVAL